MFDELKEISSIVSSHFLSFFFSLILVVIAYGGLSLVSLMDNL